MEKDDRKSLYYLCGVGNFDTGTGIFHFSQFIFKEESEEVIKSLVQEIHGSWVNFAKTGDPNPEWLRFAGYNSPVRIFDRESKTVRLDRSELMRVWDDMRFYEK